MSGRGGIGVDRAGAAPNRIRNHQEQVMCEPVVEPIPTVADLIAYLQTLPPTLPILERRCSDYHPMPMGSWRTAQAAKQLGEDWWRVAGPSWPDIPADIDPGRVVGVLIYEGN